MVRPERIELPTSWFVAKHSIQLSYGRIVAELRILNYNGTKSFRPTPTSDTVSEKTQRSSTTLPIHAHSSMLWKIVAFAESLLRTL
jgi:hypothetical protein